MILGTRSGYALTALLLLACPQAAPAAGPEAPEEVAEDWFVEVAEEAGLDFVHFNGMSGRLYFAEMMGGGAALADYDGDGDLDVFLVQGEMLGAHDVGEAVFPAPEPGELGDRLYRNDLWVDTAGRRHLTFVEVSERAGIPAGGYGMGVASADLDGNGSVDFYITMFGANRLLLNRGDGSFVDATTSSGAEERRWSVAASPIDVDGDGRLDLYVGNYTPYRIATHRNCFSDTGVLDYCGPSGAEPDRLFLSAGGGRFEDVSRRSGIGLVAGAGLGSVVADFDGDGRSDLFVANDADRNNLWINQGDGSFVDDAVLAGTAVNLDGRPEASMGVVVGDLNADGVDDLFMSHLTNETNTYYLGSGDGLFDDVSNDSGLGLPSWRFTGFGIALLDFDNDTDLDLFVANGAVKLITEQVAAGDTYPLHQVNQLFENDGAGRFTEVGSRAGAALALSEVSRGAASGDVDLDGDLDILVANNAGPVRLLSNRVGASRGWIGVELRPVAGLPTPIGSGVVVDAGGRRRRQRVATDGSYASANAPGRVFGLGSTERATSLEVVFGAGGRLRFESPPGRRLLVVPVSPAPEGSADG